MIPSVNLSVCVYVMSGKQKVQKSMLNVMQIMFIQFEFCYFARNLSAENDSKKLHVLVKSIGTMSVNCALNKTMNEAHLICSNPL